MEFLNMKKILILCFMLASFNAFAKPVMMQFRVVDKANAEGWVNGGFVYNAYSLNDIYTVVNKIIANKKYKLESMNQPDKNTLIVVVDDGKPFSDEEEERLAKEKEAAMPVGLVDDAVEVEALVEKTEEATTEVASDENKKTEEVVAEKTEVATEKAEVVAE